MFPRNFFTLCLFVIAFVLVSSPAYSQQDDSSSQPQNSQAQDKSTVEGTVVASSRTTFVVK